MVEVRNIAFSYGESPVLRDVSFVASPGEVISVVGANGAGKTSLLRILATLAVPDSGVVLVDGQDAFSRPLRYRRQIGYFPERIALCDDMTVKDYLTYRAHLKGEPPKRVRRRVSETAELCQIGDILKRPIGVLSAGFKKRVALADVLLLRPRLLLLDDLMAGLDYEMREATGSILSGVAAFSSIVITGHEFADFANWTTRFLVLRHGIIYSSIENAGVDRNALMDRLDAALKGGGK